jgi:hypothetical protein
MNYRLIVQIGQVQSLRFETNDNDALIPEVWAAESVAILVENMVAANLIHRDFSNEIAEYGDVVNTRQPSTFTAWRKTDSDDVTVQNAESTNIPVTLNQHFHVSFRIRDGEESKAFKDLVEFYLEPAVIAMAQAIDKVVLGQAVQFIGNVAGYIGGLSSTTAKDYILDTRKVMNDNKVPVAGRNLILGSASETEVLKDDTFTSAEKVGDEGTALREASLGRKLGFNIYMCQNMSDFTYLDTGTADTINNGNITAGSTAITLDDSSVATVGDMITVGQIAAGTGIQDGVPQLVTANNGTTEVLTISPGLVRDIVDAAVVSVWDGFLLNETTAASLLAGFAKGVNVDGFTADKPPKVGQFIRIGDASTCTSSHPVYCIREITYVAGETEAILFLDRPYDSAVVNNAIIAAYPSGKYNFAFHRNAVALVSRPLAPPKSGTGALSAVVDFGGVAMRTTITYDGVKQGHLVTVDLLCGIAVLDSDLGAVMLG